MNNTCKLLTVITTLAAFGAEAMQQAPGGWEFEIWGAECHPEDHLAQFLCTDYIDYGMSLFAPALFARADLDREVLISADEEPLPLRQVIFRKGKIFTAHALLVANMLKVSVPELAQCILECGDDAWNSYNCVETAARLIALIAKQQGGHPVLIIETIKQQANQNPQQHRYLIEWLTGSNNHNSFEQILAQHGL